MSEKVLELRDVTMQFGGVVAVNNLSMEVRKGEIVSLIGPNGAGKTTVFNVITGVYDPTNGEVLLDDKVVVAGHPKGKMKKLYNGENAGKYTRMITKTPDKITKLGVARTFQNIRLFKEMSVIDNVKVGLHYSHPYTVFDALFHTPKYKKAEAAMQEEALSLLRVFHLEEFAESKAKNLPYGKQRKLEIARALATAPKLLLLDEPAAGMNPTETAELMETIKIVREKFSVAILLIEHDMKLVMGICEKIAVLNFGTVLAFGTPEEIRNNPDVVAAYLGNEEEG